MSFFNGKINVRLQAGYIMASGGTSEGLRSGNETNKAVGCNASLISSGGLFFVLFLLKKIK
jgi:hypothetical protein